MLIISIYCLLNIWINIMEINIMIYFCVGPTLLFSVWDIPGYFIFKIIFTFVIFLFFMSVIFLHHLRRSYQILLNPFYVRFFPIAVFFLSLNMWTIPLALLKTSLALLLSSNMLFMHSETNNRTCFFTRWWAWYSTYLLTLVKLLFFENRTLKAKVRVIH